MSDVALVTGPTSAMNFAAALAESDVSPADLTVLMKTELTLDHPFTALTRRTVEQLAPPSRFAAWDGTSPVSAPACDRLWLCRPFRPPEKRLAAALADAPIMIFDEGLGSFADRPVDPAPTSDPASFAKPSVPGWLIERIAACYFSVSGPPTPAHLRQAPVQRIPAERMCRSLGAFGAARVGVRGATLIAGTAFHLSGGVAAADEQDHYLRLIKRFAEKGEPVIWAPHPRAAEAFADAPAWRAAEESGAFLTAPVAQGAPVELLGLEGAVARVVSLGGSPLLTFPDWFGVEAMASRDPRFDDVSRRLEHVQLVRDTLPVVEVGLD
ncbi:MAG: hypothetical protein AAFR11_01430 [Pseudomonadota bacterium]